MNKLVFPKKGGFVKGCFGECALVPLFCTVVPFFTLFPVGGFRNAGFCTLVPVFVPSFWSLGSGVVPANQTEESEVRELLGKESELVPEPPFVCKIYINSLKEGVPEPVPDSFLESSRTGATPNGVWEHLPKSPFWKPPFANPRIIAKWGV